MDIEKRVCKADGVIASDFGSILAPGISFGFIVGLLLENTGMGLSLGLASAVFLNAIQEKRQRAKGSIIAVVIATAALIVAVGLRVFVG